MAVRSTHGRIQKNTWYCIEKKAHFTFNTMFGGTLSGMKSAAERYANTLPDYIEGSQIKMFTIEKHDNKLVIS